MLFKVICKRHPVSAKKNHYSRQSIYLKNKGCILLLSLFFLTFSVFSQTDTVTVQELIKLPFEDLINMTVSSASKIRQEASDAPSIVSVVFRDQLKKYQWLSLNNVAAKQAGFTLGQDRFNRVIVSRGISDLLWSKRLLLLFDGVPYSSFQSSVSDEALSLYMAKNVEIIRGPGASLYGSQAVTGLIQVNSMSYADLTGKGEIDLKAGDYGCRNLNILTGSSGEKTNTVIAFNNFGSYGNEYYSYDALLKRDPQGNFIKHKTQDEKRSTHFYTKISAKDKLEGLSLSYHFQTYDFQMGHGFLTIFPEIESTSNVTRNYIMAKYVTPPGSKKKLKHEYVLKYDREVSSFNMQIVPAGFKRNIIIGYDNTGAPILTADSSGIWEQYVTPVHNGFARTQWIYFFDNKATLMGGIEQDLVYYTGDKLHYSNVNLNEPGFIPFANNQISGIKPLYEPIQNHPVNNNGIYGQFTSGNLLGDQLTLTLGLRNDIYFYKYKDLQTMRDTSRLLTHQSPRVVLVYSVNENLSFKGIYGNAFRVASPFEQFIANSLISGSGRGTIKPENINSFELSSDCIIRSQINWRNTLFYSIFNDQIRSSRGAFTNVINTTQAGAESEIHLYFNSFSAFANYSFVKRIKESSTDPLIKTSNSLIWYPAHSVNAGISYHYKKAALSAQSHYQGKVDRRSSEKGAPASGANAGVNYDELRGGSEVKAWFTLDLNLNYHINDKWEIRLAAVNLLDKKYNLINNLAFLPFDYQQAGRRIIVSLKMIL